MRWSRLGSLLLHLHQSQALAKSGPIIVRLQPSPTLAAVVKQQYYYNPVPWAFGLFTMASDVPYPTLPAEYKEDLKDEEGQAMSKR